MGKPYNFDQASFRGRNDTQALNSSTFTHSLNTGWSQDVDATFRCRFLVQETNGGDTDPLQFKWQYNHDGGGWNDVSGTSPLQWDASGQYADDDATTQVLGSGSFTAGDGSESDNITTSVDVGLSSETEFEGAFTIDSAQVANAETIDLRMVESNGTLFTAYSNTPTITVVEGGAAYQKTLTETVDVSDDLSRAVVRALTESADVADTIFKNTVRSLAETVNAAVVYSRVWNLARTMTETVVVSDSIYRKIVRTMTETVVAADTLFTQLIKQIILTEGIVVADSLLRNIAKTLTETVDAADTLYKKIIKMLSLENIDAADSESPIGSPASLYLRYATGGGCGNVTRRVLMNNNGSTAYTHVTQAGYTGISWNYQATDWVVSAGTWYIKLWGSSFDNSTVNVRLQRVNSSCAVQETILQKTTSGYGVGIELKTVSQSNSKVTFAKDDYFILSVGTATGAGATIRYNGTVTPQQANSRIEFPGAITTTSFWSRGTGKLMSETVNAADSIQRRTGKVLSETVNVADTILRLIKKTLLEVADVADTIRRSVKRTLSEAVNVADSLRKKIAKMLSEAVKAADTLIKGIIGGGGDEGKVYTLDVDVEYQGVTVPAAITADGIIPNETDPVTTWTGTDSPLHLGINEGISGYSNADWITTKNSFRAFLFGFTDPALSPGAVVAQVTMQIAIRADHDPATGYMPSMQLNLKIAGMWQGQKLLDMYDLPDGVEQVVSVTWPGLAFSQADIATMELFGETGQPMSGSDLHIYAIEASIRYQVTTGEGTVKGIKFKRELGPLQFKQKTLSFRSKRLEHGLRFRGTSIFPKED